MTRIACTAIAALFLAALTGSLNAQQSPPMPPAEVPQASPSAPQGEADDDWDWQRWPHRMREWMMGDDDRRPRHMRGWGNRMPMHSRMMPMIMMALVDTDESGSLSYEEVEAVHRRMFNLADKDKNGELSPEEIQAVMGWRHKRPRSAR